MNLELRPLREEEFDDWVRADARAFGTHLVESDLPYIKRSRELDRTLVVLDEGQIVGATTAHTSEMTIPGGDTLPCAIVDDVAVQPTHRRRGILTSLMERQLKDFHERGDVLAALSASESSIYQRFGYGIGTLREDWEIERSHTAFAHSPEIKGRTRFVGPGEARELFIDMEKRACSHRPGYMPMKPEVLDMWLADVEHVREGAGAFFYVVYEEDGRIDGFVMYRLKDHKVLVWWLIGATPSAHAALWRYCFGIDLMEATQARSQSLDDPLPWMLAESRFLRRTVKDAVWLRLVDVPAALSARSYANDGSLVLEVTDKFCPWNQGTLALDVENGKAVCNPTNQSPDLVLTASELASVYLGASRFHELTRGGRVEERTEGAIERADRMFATYMQPWMPGF